MAIFFQGSAESASLQSNTYQCSGFSIWWVNWESAFWPPRNENAFRFVLFGQLTQIPNMVSALPRSHTVNGAGTGSRIQFLWSFPTLHCAFCRGLAFKICVLPTAVCFSNSIPSVYCLLEHLVPCLDLRPGCRRGQARELLSVLQANSWQKEWKSS